MAHDDDHDARVDEVEALRAIYGDDEFDELESTEAASRAGLSDDATFLPAYRVTIRSGDPPAAAAAVGLAFRQPPGYPSSAPLTLAVRDMHG